MGKGKGSVDHYVAKVRPGRILYEIGGVERETARAALELAAAKLPIRTKLLVKGLDPWIREE
jgi:large subunit ribosomal protein L16